MAQQLLNRANACLCVAHRQIGAAFEQMRGTLLHDDRRAGNNRCLPTGLCTGYVSLSYCKSWPSWPLDDDSLPRRPLYKIFTVLRPSLVLERHAFASIGGSFACAPLQVHPMKYLGAHHQTVRTK